MSLDGAHLNFVNAAGVSVLHAAKGRKFCVGSSLGSDLVLPDAERLHCEIQCDAFGRVTIYNHSRNEPILLNDQVLHATSKRPLFHGARIQILNDVYTWNFPKGDEQSTTPDRAPPEPAANSSPTIKGHRQRRQFDNRLTVHNFRYSINSDDEGNTSIESRELETSSSSNSAEISATAEAECNDSLADKDANETLPKVDLLEATQNKENTSTLGNKLMLQLCARSDVVITSFSPRETGVKIEKSFTCVMKPSIGMGVSSTVNTPKSTYNTPKSVLSEVNEDSCSRDLLEYSTPSTSKKALAGKRPTSMYLIDLTTPQRLRPTLSGTPKQTPGILSADSTDESSDASVIVIDTTPSTTPATQPQQRRVIKTPKDQLLAAGSTPRRTPQSLMKKALLTSAKKQIRTPITPQDAPNRQAVLDARRQCLTAPRRLPFHPQPQWRTPGRRQIPGLEVRGVPQTSPRKRPSLSLNTPRDNKISKLRKTLAANAKISPTVGMSNKLVAKARRALNSPKQDSPKRMDSPKVDKQLQSFEPNKVSTPDKADNSNAELSLTFTIDDENNTTGPALEQEAASKSGLPVDKEFSDELKIKESNTKDVSLEKDSLNKSEKLLSLDNESKQEAELKESSPKDVSLDQEAVNESSEELKLNDSPKDAEQSKDTQTSTQNEACEGDALNTTYDLNVSQSKSILEASSAEGSVCLIDTLSKSNVDNDSSVGISKNCTEEEEKCMKNLATEDTEDNKSLDRSEVVAVIEDSFCEEVSTTPTYQEDLETIVQLAEDTICEEVPTAGPDSSISHGHTDTEDQNAEQFVAPPGETPRPRRSSRRLSNPHTELVATPRRSVRRASIDANIKLGQCIKPTRRASCSAVVESQLAGVAPATPRRKRRLTEDLSTPTRKSQRLSCNTPKSALPVDEAVGDMGVIIEEDAVGADKLPTVSDEDYGSELPTKDTDEPDKIDYHGMRELLKTPKSCSTPHFKGLRDLIRTPKVHPSPMLGNIDELLETPSSNASTPKRSVAVSRVALELTKSETTSDNQDMYFKTPRGKNLMIPSDPASAVLKSIDNSLATTTEYDLNATNATLHLDKIFDDVLAAETTDPSILVEESENEINVTAISTVTDPLSTSTKSVEPSDTVRSEALMSVGYVETSHKDPLTSTAFKKGSELDLNKSPSDPKSSPGICDVSGIQMLDQTTDSMFSEPLMVSRVDSFDVTLEETKATATVDLPNKSNKTDIVECGSDTDSMVGLSEPLVLSDDEADVEDLNVEGQKELGIKNDHVDKTELDTAKDSSISEKHLTEQNPIDLTEADSDLECTLEEKNDQDSDNVTSQIENDFSVELEDSCITTVSDESIVKTELTGTSTIYAADTSQINKALATESTPPVESIIKDSDKDGNEEDSIVELDASNADTLSLDDENAVNKSTVEQKQNEDKVRTKFSESIQAEDAEIQDTTQLEMSTEKPTEKLETENKDQNQLEDTDTKNAEKDIELNKPEEVIEKSAADLLLNDTIEDNEKSELKEYKNDVEDIHAEKYSKAEVGSTSTNESEIDKAETDQKTELPVEDESLIQQKSLTEKSDLGQVESPEEVFIAAAEDECIKNIEEVEEKKSEEDKESLGDQVAQEPKSFSEHSPKKIEDEALNEIENESDASNAANDKFIPEVITISSEESSSESKAIKACESSIVLDISVVAESEKIKEVTLEFSTPSAEIPSTQIDLEFTNDEDVLEKEEISTTENNDTFKTETVKIDDSLVKVDDSKTEDKEMLTTSAAIQSNQGEIENTTKTDWESTTADESLLLLVEAMPEKDEISSSNCEKPSTEPEDELKSPVESTNTENSMIVLDEERTEEKESEEISNHDEIENKTQTDLNADKSLVATEPENEEKQSDVEIESQAVEDLSVKDETKAEESVILSTSAELSNHEEMSNATDDSLVNMDTSVVSEIKNIEEHINEQTAEILSTNSEISTKQDEIENEIHVELESEQEVSKKTEEPIDEKSQMEIDTAIDQAEKQLDEPVSEIILTSENKAQSETQLKNLEYSSVGLKSLEDSSGDQDAPNETTDENINIPEISTISLHKLDSESTATSGATETQVDSEKSLHELEETNSKAVKSEQPEVENDVEYSDKDNSSNVSDKVPTVMDEFSISKHKIEVEADEQITNSKNDSVAIETEIQMQDQESAKESSIEEVNETLPEVETITENKATSDENAPVEDVTEITKEPIVTVPEETTEIIKDTTPSDSKIEQQLSIECSPVNDSSVHAESEEINSDLIQEHHDMIISDEAINVQSGSTEVKSPEVPSMRVEDKEAIIDLDTSSSEEPDSMEDDSKEGTFGKENTQAVEEDLKEESFSTTTVGEETTQTVADNLKEELFATNTVGEEKPAEVELDKNPKVQEEIILETADESKISEKEESTPTQTEEPATQMIEDKDSKVRCMQQVKSQNPNDQEEISTGIVEETSKKPDNMVIDLISSDEESSTQASSTVGSAFESSTSNTAENLVPDNKANSMEQATRKMRDRKPSKLIETEMTPRKRTRKASASVEQLAVHEDKMHTMDNKLSEEPENLEVPKISRRKSSAKDIETEAENVKASSSQMTTEKPKHRGRKSTSEAVEIEVHVKEPVNEPIDLEKPKRRGRKHSPEVVHKEDKNEEVIDLTKPKRRGRKSEEIVKGEDVSTETETPVAAVDLEKPTRRVRKPSADVVKLDLKKQKKVDTKSSEEEKMEQFHDSDRSRRRGRKHSEDVVRTEASQEVKSEEINDAKAQDDSEKLKEGTDDLEEQQEVTETKSSDEQIPEHIKDLNKPKRRGRKATTEVVESELQMQQKETVEEDNSRQTEDLNKPKRQLRKAAAQETHSEKETENKKDLVKPTRRGRKATTELVETEEKKEETIEPRRRGRNPSADVAKPETHTEKTIENEHKEPTPTPEVTKDKPKRRNRKASAEVIDATESVELPERKSSRNTRKASAETVDNEKASKEHLAVIDETGEPDQKKSRLEEPTDLDAAHLANRRARKPSAHVEPTGELEEPQASGSREKRVQKTVAVEELPTVEPIEAAEPKPKRRGRNASADSQPVELVEKPTRRGRKPSAEVATEAEPAANKKNTRRMRKPSTMVEVTVEEPKKMTARRGRKVSVSEAEKEFDVQTLPIPLIEAATVVSVAVSPKPQLLSSEDELTPRRREGRNLPRKNYDETSDEDKPSSSSRRNRKPAAGKAAGTTTPKPAETEALSLAKPTTPKPPAELPLEPPVVPAVMPVVVPTTPVVTIVLPDPTSSQKREGRNMPRKNYSETSDDEKPSTSRGRRVRQPTIKALELLVDASPRPATPKRRGGKAKATETHVEEPPEKKLAVEDSTPVTVPTLAKSRAATRRRAADVDEVIEAESVATTATKRGGRSRKESASSQPEEVNLEVEHKPTAKRNTRKAKIAVDEVADEQPASKKPRGGARVKTPLVAEVEKVIEAVEEPKEVPAATKRGGGRQARAVKIADESEIVQETAPPLRTGRGRKVHFETTEEVMSMAKDEQSAATKAEAPKRATRSRRK